MLIALLIVGFSGGILLVVFRDLFVPKRRRAGYDRVVGSMFLWLGRISFIAFAAALILFLYFAFVDPSRNP